MGDILHALIVLEAFEVSMAEQKSSEEAVCYWLLIKGCTKSPENVDSVQKKGVGGQYLKGLKYDFSTVQQNIEEGYPGEKWELFNTVENMRSLTRQTAIEEIKALCNHAYINRSTHRTA